MTIAAPLGIIGLVLGFLATLLTQFPGQATLASTPPDGEAEAAYAQQAEEVGRRFNSVYFQVVDDLMSYAQDPDPSRAEQRRLEMVGYANASAPQFQALATQLTEQGQTLGGTEGASGQQGQ